MAAKRPLQDDVFKFYNIVSCTRLRLERYHLAMEREALLSSQVLVVVVMMMTNSLKHKEKTNLLCEIYYPKKELYFKKYNTESKLNITVN